MREKSTKCIKSFEKHTSENKTLPVQTKSFNSKIIDTIQDYQCQDRKAYITSAALYIIQAC